ncbi:hypothetical protein L6164_003789 [Bauhinia variegata]|uniref:Uncharacterized protein n=1 Tax=Bauhinia variegata TaxID=167791 RepID=A0ACB9Q3W5_BAUVA|nr:hypothetical protein L6164_003789 [Bauhinia variegata]
MGSTMQPKKFNPIERRPRLLKDFLDETSNSCSSRGFKSFPRKPISAPNSSSMRSLIEIDLNSRNSNPRILQRLSSKSAFQTLVNAFKFRSISFSTVKSPSILPRSLSRKLSRRNSTRRENEKKASEIKITVKIKDIIRWKSFRDLVEEQSPPLDCALSPQRCTTTTTTAKDSTSSSCSSNGSSWSDSDFTDSWDGNFAVEVAQNDVASGKMLPPVVGKGKDSVEKTTGKPSYAAVGAKEVFSYQEEEQQSPVSVLDVGEDEFSAFDQSLANIERKKQKFMESIHKFENLAKLDLENLEKWLSSNENEEYDEVEERARQLLNCVKAQFSDVQSYESNVLLDFFRDELNSRKKQTKNDDGFEWRC